MRREAEGCSACLGRRGGPRTLPSCSHKELSGFGCTGPSLLLRGEEGTRDRNVGFPRLISRFSLRKGTAAPGKEAPDLLVWGWIRAAQSKPGPLSQPRTRISPEQRWPSMSATHEVKLFLLPPSSCPTGLLFPAVNSGRALGPSLSPGTGARGELVRNKVTLVTLNHFLTSASRVVPLRLHWPHAAALRGYSCPSKHIQGVPKHKEAQREKDSFWFALSLPSERIGNLHILLGKQENNHVPSSPG